MITRSAAPLVMIISASLSLMIGVGHAQVIPPLAELKITVVDEAGALIPGSEIAISSHSEKFQLHTDASGSVKAKLQTGRYDVVARRPGFLKREISDLYVLAPESKILQIVLKVDQTPIVDGLLPSIGPETSTSDVPATLGSQPFVPATGSGLRKRSWRCLYLWRCDQAL